MFNFLTSFSSIHGLSYPFNFFPYYHHNIDDIKYFAHDPRKNFEENLERLQLCCFQFYQKYQDLIIKVNERIRRKIDT